MPEFRVGDRDLRTIGGDGTTGSPGVREEPGTDDPHARATRGIAPAAPFESDIDVHEAKACARGDAHRVSIRGPHFPELESVSTSVPPSTSMPWSEPRMDRPWNSATVPAPPMVMESMLAPSAASTKTHTTLDGQVAMLSLCQDQGRVGGCGGDGRCEVGMDGERPRCIGDLHGGCGCGGASKQTESGDDAHGGSRLRRWDRAGDAIWAPGHVQGRNIWTWT